MKTNNKQQELADKIARLKASKGKNIQTKSDSAGNIPHGTQTSKVKAKPAPVKNVKAMKNMSSGRKG